MKLIDFLLANQVPLDLKNYKIHLASISTDSPLEAYYEGWFKEWQQYQTRRNFECNHIVSLIQLPERNKWLFVGVYKSLGSLWNEAKANYEYTTELIKGHEIWIGRVVVYHERGGRAAYLWGHEDGGAFTLNEIREKKLTIEEFPGFNWTSISYGKLKTIVEQEITSWKTALSNVKGIYAITDMLNGKIYVGKADGECGLWQRWTAYVWSGHGGNKELRELLGTNPPEYLSNFQFSILEIADSRATDDHINARENHWKVLLRSREHGYNAN